MCLRHAAVLCGDDFGVSRVFFVYPLVFGVTRLV